MLSAEIIILEYVCPLAGVVTATVMFSAPYRDVLKATSETGQLGDLNPTPWAFMFGNCLGWVAYSMLTHNLFLLFANAPALILSIWLNMAAVKLQYENHKSSEMRKSLVDHLQTASTRGFIIQDEPSEQALKHQSSTRKETAQEADERALKHQSTSDKERAQEADEEKGHQGFGDLARVVWDVTSQHKPSPAPHERLVLGIATVWIAVISLVAFGQSAFGEDTGEIIVGITVNINLVFFYGAPLSSIAEVLRKQTTASIHIPTMVTNTANSVFWTAYGLAIWDLFIAIPNGLGAVLGVIQILLCFLFPREKKQKATVEQPGNK
eukprot:CAMPEP_0198138498 /NCGR_PEP_ID=MMETSP1443-20131203/1898_1 /TAXON_ID=186043 /ORGANISM="Entomoneis sp., Strain CCMP2396" /LENGTH=322 /DNA_ID=CAMNT_0043800291 /DNA_START=127 /DNA_END=1095 /DNA_ORIENTATION=+